MMHFFSTCQRPPKTAAPGGGSVLALPEDAFSNSSFSIPVSRASLFTMWPSRSIPSRCSFSTWNSATLSSSPSGVNPAPGRHRDSRAAPLVLHDRAWRRPLSSSSVRAAPTMLAFLAISPRRRRDSSSALWVGWPMHRAISTLRITSSSRLRSASCSAFECFMESLDDRAAFSRNCSDSRSFPAWLARVFAFSCCATMRE
mmetsp:Transcript_1655/g.3637  ORF Transcript_1655/g.3637 Transcript_1655/m.3637 type:complete len:200 (+) Transcript_1655:199-798(+)